MFLELVYSTINSPFSAAKTISHSDINTASILCDGDECKRSPFVTFDGLRSLCRQSTLSTDQIDPPQKANCLKNMQM